MWIGFSTSYSPDCVGFPYFDLYFHLFWLGFFLAWLPRLKKRGNFFKFMFIVFCCVWHVWSWCDKWYNTNSRNRMLCRPYNLDSDSESDVNQEIILIEISKHINRLDMAYKLKLTMLTKLYSTLTRLTQSYKIVLLLSRPEGCLGVLWTPCLKF